MTTDVVGVIAVRNDCGRLGAIETALERHALVHLQVQLVACDSTDWVRKEQRVRNKAVAVRERCSSVDSIAMAIPIKHSGDAWLCYM
jgi:hypothetical protein